jgi:hypothetical protein
MKYATWIIKRPEGSTPEPTIREAGGTASGAMMVDTNTVVGYLSDDVTTTGLSEWNVTVITQQEALSLAQALNPECFLADDGTIQAPPPNIN